MDGRIFTGFRFVTLNDLEPNTSWCFLIDLAWTRVHFWFQSKSLKPLKIGESGESWVVGEVRRYEYLNDEQKNNISIAQLPDRIGWRMTLPTFFPVFACWDTGVRPKNWFFSIVL